LNACFVMTAEIAMQAIPMITRSSGTKTSQLRIFGEAASTPAADKLDSHLQPLDLLLHHDIAELRVPLRRHDGRVAEHLLQRREVST